MQVRVLVSMATGLIAAAGCLSGIPQAAADLPACYSGNSCFFLSPSGNISCELHDGAGPSYAYCQSASSTQSVRLDSSGNFAPCTGDQCMTLPAMDIPTLPYGQTAGLGPFDCLSTTDGVTCTVASGRGFVISRAGVVPVG